MSLTSTTITTEDVVREIERGDWETEDDILPLASLYDKRNYGMDGLNLLRRIPGGSIPLVFFDPQYDHLLRFMKYGNKERQKGRLALPPQNEMDIWRFGQEIARSS